MTRTTKQIPSVRRIDFKEYSRYNNRLLLEQLLKEGQTVVDRVRQRLKVQPDVECGDRGHLDGKAHGGETGEDMLAFVVKVLLEGKLFLLDAGGLQEGKGSDLEGMIGSSVQEGSRL